MGKKKIILTVAIVAALAVPFSVFAATSDSTTAKNIRGFFGMNTSKLTDQQKSDVKDYARKMADLQKDFVNKMVANGAITKEQGDAELKRIEDSLAKDTANGTIPGFGIGKDGHGMKGEFGLGTLDTTKLTDALKADLLTTGKKMTALEKELISQMVTDGLYTQAQADVMIKKIDEVASEMEKDSFAKGFGLMKGFGGFGLKGMDISKLTDQQKKDLDDFSTKMNELQKEIINKLVSGGVITQAQGDAAISRMDAMKNPPMDFGSEKVFKMKEGRFGRKGMGRGNQHFPDATSSASVAPQS